MSRFDTLPDRAILLASNVGDSLRQVVPDNAGRWLNTGAKLGAIKGGARVAGFFLRRHPMLVAATAAGAGLLWYSRHRAKKARDGNTLEGSATRVETRTGRAGRSTAHTSHGTAPATD